MANELKSLTINGTKYDSFVDQEARKNAGTGTGGGGSVAGKNLFNLDEVTPDYNLSSSGSIYPSEAGAGVSGYIKVDGNTTYSFQARKDDLSIALRVMQHIAVYDENKNHIQSARNYNQGTYTTPENAVYVRFSFSNAFNSPDAQPMFFAGDAVSEYEEYKTQTTIDYHVKAENVIGLGEAIAENKYSFCKVDSVCDAYSCASKKLEFTPGSDTNRLDELYAMYDALVETYPDYVTRTLLGTIATDNLPIYRYDFTPKLPINHNAANKNKLCKILYCSGTHGAEGSTLYGARFFTDLCENWRNQDLLKVLRFNCHFTVVPAVNPYGIKYRSRKNENQVDLNRNFTNGWNNINNFDSTSIEYPGEYPASEVSTQIIENLIAVEHFDFGLDHHTFSTYADSTDKVSGYFVGTTTNPKDISFMNMMAVWMSSKTVIDNTLITDFSKSHFKTSSGLSASGYLFGAFRNGLCFENMTGWGNAEMESVYDSQKFNAETIGAIFHSAFVGYHTY